MSYNRISKDDYYLDIARAVSRRSTCLKRHYGAVIVKNDQIISTGYNGSPRGQDNCCDVLKECPRIKEKSNKGDYSNCPAVHAEQNAMLSSSRSDMIGSTLYLAGYSITKSVSGKITGNYTRTMLENGMVECYPCPICLRMILNSGISRVVGPQGEISFK